MCSVFVLATSTHSMYNTMKQLRIHKVRGRQELVTWYAVIGGFQVRLEVFGTRLSHRVHGGHKQRAILSAGAQSIHVLGDVAVATEGVCIVGRDATTRPHASVQSASDDDDVIRVAACREPLVNTVLTCLQ